MQRQSEAWRIALRFRLTVTSVLARFGSHRSAACFGDLEDPRESMQSRGDSRRFEDLTVISGGSEVRIAATEQSLELAVQDG